MKRLTINLLLSSSELHLVLLVMKELTNSLMLLILKLMLITSLEKFQLSSEHHLLDNQE
jgi:hypothetical protein